jgi:translocation and assembly module TamB
MLRIGRWILVGMAALFLLVVLAAGIVMGTTPGARWALSMAVSRSPVPVTIATVDGPLRGPLVLEGIEVEKDGLTTRIDRLVLDWRPLRLLRKTVEIDSLHVDGVTVFVPEGWAANRPPPVDTAVAEAGPPQVPVLPVEILVHDLRVGIDQVTVEGQARLAESSLTGRGTPDAFEIHADLSGSGGPVTDFRAQASLEGAPEDYQLGGDLAFTSGELPPVSGTLSATGSLTGMAVEEAILRTASGEASLTATAEWYPGITWDLTANAQNLDVAPFTPAPEQWPGTLSFQARSQGTVGEAGLDAQVSVSQIGGELRGQPLGGGLEARVTPGRMEVDTLGLSWGSALVTASGVIAEELDLAFALDVPDLGLALPGGGGSVRAAGTVAGTRDEPRLDTDFDANELRTEAAGLAGARGRISIDLSPGATSTVDIRAESMSTGEQVVDSLVLAGSGTRESHALELRAHAGESRLAAGVSGGLMSGPSEGGVSTGDAPSASSNRSAPPAWQGSLDALVVFAEPAGEWRLPEPAPLLASADAASLETACLAQEASRICLGGSWDRAAGSQGELSIVALPLELARASLPENMEIAGQVDGEARFAMAGDGALSGDGVITVVGTIDATVAEEVQSFQLSGDGLSFQIDDTGAVAELRASLSPEATGGDFRFDGSVALPGYTSASIPLEEQSLEGQLDVRSDDLSFLSAFSPLVENAGGRLQVESALAGTAAAPEVLGSLALQDGLFDLPTLGLELRDAQVLASGDSEGMIELDGSVTSGEGRFEIEGRTPVKPSPDSPARVTLRGERFRAVDTPEIQVEIAPELEIGFDGSLATVEGRISVPWARIELLEVPPAAIPPSPDVVFVDDETPPPPDVRARVDIVIGDDVRFDGLGFTSNIEGELNVVQDPGEDPNLLGELRFVDGRYAAYGQNLEIDPGRIVIAGPVEDASLDVTALRTASDGTEAGFVVTGNMLAPEVEITSDPAMSDADALSYILYGKHLDDGDPSQQEQVAGAVASLGANVLTTKLAGSVGLDEARIEGATKDQAELVAGKYLTPSLYVSYGLGLFKPSNTFRIKYLLTSAWAVQAESGEATGGDLIYQIERGR